MMYLFNPDNDLAFANFNSNYTPPASARKIADDLAVLPIWYAPEGEKVVAEGEHNRRFLESMNQILSIPVSLVSFSDISLFPQEEIVPWGWNPALRKRLLDAGVSEENILSPEALKQLRKDSGRQNAVHILNELKVENDVFCGESHFFSSTDDVLTFLSSRDGNKVLKMPNSGSGKGLVWILGDITDKQIDWCRRVIREQGGIVAEPVLNKVQDFAMEFYADYGKIGFVGYSLFQSAASGAYMGNFLMPDAEIETKLAKYTDKKLLQQLQTHLAKKISLHFPHYSGVLGVDMMVCNTAEGYRIQPCVEINMRMNMGVVAHTFLKRFVKNGSTGKFGIRFFKKQGDALVNHNEMKRKFPLVVNETYITRGYLSLNPVNENTRYVAWVLIQ